MNEHSRRENRNGVVSVTFTRDQKLNAISAPMLDMLRDAVADLADNDDLQVLLIRAEGRFFTVGSDISEMGNATGVGSHGREYGTSLRRDYRKLHLLFDEFEAVEKPVVIAMQGPCLGIGLEMASSCDFRLASDAATFALPEIANLAVIPGSGGISRLTRLIGPHWARWIVVAGQTVDAHQAQSIGLVHRVIPEAEFDVRVTEFAQHLTALPREAVGLAKIAIDAAADGDRIQARNIDRIANTLLLKSDDHLAKVAEFKKRTGGSRV